MFKPLLGGGDFFLEKLHGGLFFFGLELNKSRYYHLDAKFNL